jgi:hypothetical protein
MKVNYLEEHDDECDCSRCHKKVVRSAKKTRESMENKGQISIKKIAPVIQLNSDGDPDECDNF